MQGTEQPCHAGPAMPAAAIRGCRPAPGDFPCCFLPPDVCHQTMGDTSSSGTGAHTPDVIVHGSLLLADPLQKPSHT